MARITIMGPSGRQERQLFRHNSLGRHPRNTHQVLDRVVSKEHCHIELLGEDYVLKDLGSLNGTFINGQRVAGEQQLEHRSSSVGPPRGRMHDDRELELLEKATPDSPSR